MRNNSMQFDLTRQVMNMTGNSSAGKNQAAKNNNNQKSDFKKLMDDRQQQVNSDNRNTQGNNKKDEAAAQPGSDNVISQQPAESEQPEVANEGLMAQLTAELQADMQRIATLLQTVQTADAPKEAVLPTDELQLAPPDAAKELIAVADTALAVVDEGVPVMQDVKAQIEKPAEQMNRTDQMESVDTETDGMPVQAQGTKQETSQQPDTDTNQAEPQQVSTAKTAETSETTIKSDTQVQQIIQPEVKPQTVQTPPAVQNAETVHIPVNNQDELIQKLTDAMIVKATANQNEFEVQLEPANLGKLTIKIAYSAGKTAVEIMCSSEKTLNILAQSAKSIAMIMESNLGTGTTVYVEQGEDNYLNQSRDGQNQQGEQQEQENQNSDAQKDEPFDFLQQLRLGLVKGTDE